MSYYSLPDTKDRKTTEKVMFSHLVKIYICIIREIIQYDSWSDM